MTPSFRYLGNEHRPGETKRQKIFFKKIFDFWARQHRRVVMTVTVPSALRFFFGGRAVVFDFGLFARCLPGGGGGMRGRSGRMVVAHLPMACWMWCSSRLVIPSSMFFWIVVATFSFVIICGTLTVLIDLIGVRLSPVRWNGM